MKIACLQFAPELGKVKENIARADDIIERELQESEVGNIDILVLPELAFSGREHHPIHIQVFLLIPFISRSTLSSYEAVIDDCKGTTFPLSSL